MPGDKDRIEELTGLNDALENYFLNTIIPQLFIDADMKLRKFTPPAMRQFDLKKSDVGKDVHDIIDNFRFPSFIENIHSVIGHQEILEKEIQTTDLRWYQMNIIPYVNFATSKTDGVIVTFVEITHRIKDLKEQERLIADHETLLDTLSHDIKNPLSNLVLAIENFKSMNPADRQEFDQLLGIVDRALTKMQNLIIDLTATREDDHRYKVKYELLNVEHIWEDVRLLLNEDIQRSHAVISTDFAASEIYFVRRKLRSIVYNLVSNAIKYKSPAADPHITIHTKLHDDFFIITIQDNGMGIEPGKREAIFDKYYRLDNAIEGSGIGLYLVREIVNNEGGKIELQSETGKGTTVIISLKSL